MPGVVGGDRFADQSLAGEIDVGDDVDRAFVVDVDSGADAVTKQPARVFSHSNGEVQHLAISTQSHEDDQRHCAADNEFVLLRLSTVHQVCSYDVLCSFFYLRALVNYRVLK